MDRADVLALLGRADEASGLPRVGGMARADGVVIASDRYWAFARRDGTVREGAMPSPPAFLARIPLVRGKSVAPRRERAFLAAAILAPLALVFLPQSAALPLAITVAALLLCWLL